MISYHTKMSESEKSSSDDDTLLILACKYNSLHVAV